MSGVPMYCKKENSVMRRSVLIFSFCLLAMFSVAKDKKSDKSGLPSNAISLVDGYKITTVTTVDTDVWKIEKPGGMTIDFEAGPSAGFVVKESKIQGYFWYREQVVNGYDVLLALEEPERNGEGAHKRRLLVTFLLGRSKSSGYAANFSAELSNDQELADALVMILTFDPHKAHF